MFPKSTDSETIPDQVRHDNVWHDNVQNDSYKIKIYLLNIHQYAHTLRYLKWPQIWYRLPVLKKIGRPVSKEKLCLKEAGKVSGWLLSISAYSSYSDHNKLTFLNQSHSFSDEIDWGFLDYGMLWTYNLNYFEFLVQKDMTVETGYRLIDDFLARYENLTIGRDPYPISLRLLFWIRFFIKQEKQPAEKYLQALHLQAKELQAKLEYHLLGNHLLENAFALFFTGRYLRDKSMQNSAKKLLLSELKEQILPDGGHFELSPMYHQLMFYRVLDCYNLVKNNDWKENGLEDLLKDKAELMLGWLGNMSFKNGEIPYLNDAAPGIAPTSDELFEYAEELGLQAQPSRLNESGYRKFDFENLEVVLDVGQIAPKYQPGHSHADSLQFVLHYKNRPIVVDTGISTYEKNERRQIERSTHSHNTVTINGENSTKVWSGFRAAERAKVKILKEDKNNIKASHNGYRNLGVTHARCFKHDEKCLYITDFIKGKKARDTAEGHLHFHPEVKLKLEGQKLKVNEELLINFSGTEDLKLIKYKFAKGYNNLLPAQKLVYRFEEQAELKIQPIVKSDLKT